MINAMPKQNTFTKVFKLTHVTLMILFLSACSKNDSSFTEMPGFKQYFAKNKPSTILPSDTDQALLETFRPRIFLAKGQTSFIDFYADYIANGSLYVNKKLVSKQVNQKILNKYKNNVTAEFRHSPTKKQGTPTVYARIHRDELIHDEQRIPLTFLSYNLVFAHSGLVKGIAGWQRLAMGIVASNTDWHQLDHYVGLTIALSNKKPIAVMLQQHNYQTTYLVSEKTSENTMQLPTDQRISVDVAMQSNELYLHSKQQTRHPGLSWITGDSIEFLKTGKNKPTMAGWDITHGEVEQKYTLKYLPTADAFYTFKGKLGKGRKLPGRDGPPGADYVTWPTLMPLPNRMASGYRPNDLTREKEKIIALFNKSEFSVKDDGLAAYKHDFLRDLNKQ